MFSAKVNSLYSRLTMKEKRIADYLIVNGDEAEGMTSYELAERLGVGQATVVRFSKKLGYWTFGEMIDDVKKSVGESSEIVPDDAPNEILDKLEKKTREIIETVRRANDGDSFAQAAACIDAAESIVCYGYTTSGIFAAYLCEQLLELGKDAHCEDNTIRSKRRILQLDPTRDVVVVISKSGEKAEPLGIAEHAKRCGVTLIAVSDASDNSLARLADISLRVFEIGDRSAPTASMGVAAGVLYVIESLVACVFQRNQRLYRKRYGNNIVAAFSERK